MPTLEEELFPSTLGKFKIERGRAHHFSAVNRRCYSSMPNMFLWALFLIALTALYLSFWSFIDTGNRSSVVAHRPYGISVLVTGAAGLIGSHVSLYLKKRGDGFVGIDNFNFYYDPSLKRARKSLLNQQGIFLMEGDINDARLLAKLFVVVVFTHVMHLAAQAGVRYVMENPNSYAQGGARNEREGRGR